MDGFHLSNAQLDRLGRRDRKGAPDTFDVNGYVAALHRVVSGYGETDVYVPEFDRAIEESVAAGLVVPHASRLVVTEGEAEAWVNAVDEPNAVTVEATRALCDSVLSENG